MKITLAIVGLGQIGASVGLALANQGELIQRLGYDLDPTVTRQAEKLNAIDRSASRPEEVAAGADVVLMALPADQMRTAMEQIAPHMKASAVLMDTALSKELVSNWARELFGNGGHYVGLTPVINPAYLVSTSSGILSARADLFHNGMIAISAPLHTDPTAIKLAADLTRLLGAAVLFADLLEVDSLMAATHIVPQLMAAALLNATVDQPNWREAGKMAGRAYAEVSGPIKHLGFPGTLAATATQNRENVLRVLNSVIASLETLRDDIAHQDSEALTKRLEHARKGRDQWWLVRHPEELQKRPPVHEKSSMASTLFGNLLRTGGRKSKTGVKE
jgi:prephenate dehydrogenase